MESALQEKGTPRRERSSEDKKLEREKQNLLLSRRYIQQQIESSSNTRYTETLRKAIEEIDHKLSELVNHS